MLKGRVLLLNQNFDVLGTIGIARSIRMMLREENPISVLEYVPDGYLTSGNGTKFPVPSVMVLRHFVNVRGARDKSGGTRLKVFIRDHHTCQYCATKVGKKHPVTKEKLLVKDLTLDHVLPKSKGGSSLASNLVTACKTCNQRKADRTPKEANMPLIMAIKDISAVGIENIRLCQYVESRPEWYGYLEHKEGFVETYKNYKAMAA